MFKYKITNTSVKAEKKRNVFLTEVGKLLRPGEYCCSNRVENGTRSLQVSGILTIEEGAFEAPSSVSKDEAIAAVASKEMKKDWAKEEADGAKQAAEVKAAAEKAEAEKAEAEKAEAEKAEAEKAEAAAPPAEATKKSKKKKQQSGE